MTPTIYVRESLTRLGNAEIVFRPDWAEWVFAQVGDRMAMRKALHTLLWTHRGIDPDTLRYLHAKVTEIIDDGIQRGLVRVHEPPCRQCKLAHRYHVEEHCLYSPTFYVPRGMDYDPKRNYGGAIVTKDPAFSHL